MRFPAFAGIAHAGLDPLPDHTPLALRTSCQEDCKGLPRWRGEIKRLCQRHEADP